MTDDERLLSNIEDKLENVPAFIELDIRSDVLRRLLALARDGLKYHIEHQAMKIDGHDLTPGPSAGVHQGGEKDNGSWQVTSRAQRTIDDLTVDELRELELLRSRCIASIYDGLNSKDIAWADYERQRQEWYAEHNVVVPPEPGGKDGADGKQ